MDARARHALNPRAEASAQVRLWPCSWALGPRMILLLTPEAANAIRLIVFIGFAGSARSRRSLQERDDIAGLAVASDERIEAYLLYVKPAEIVSLRSLVKDDGARLTQLLSQLRDARHGDLPVPQGPPGGDLTGTPGDARFPPRRRASTLRSASAVRLANIAVPGILSEALVTSSTSSGTATSMWKPRSPRRAPAVESAGTRCES